MTDNSPLVILLDHGQAGPGTVSAVPGPAADGDRVAAGRGERR
ncbi:hypothetical protein [Actinoplanes utahensis]